MLEKVFFLNQFPRPGWSLLWVESGWKHPGWKCPKLVEIIEFRLCDGEHENLQPGWIINRLGMKISRSGVGIMRRPVTGQILMSDWLWRILSKYKLTQNKRSQFWWVMHPNQASLAAWLSLWSPGPVTALHLQYLPRVSGALKDIWARDASLRTWTEPMCVSILLISGERSVSHCCLLQPPVRGSDKQPPPASPRCTAPGPTCSWGSSSSSSPPPRPLSSSPSADTELRWERSRRSGEADRGSFGLFCNERSEQETNLGVLRGDQPGGEDEGGGWQIRSAMVQVRGECDERNNIILPGSNTNTGI